jgi:O-antigen/teichoic acid export membrane protein
MTSPSHIKNTFKHALIYGGAGLIGKAIGFIMLPIYAHQLQAEGYGVIGMIDTVLSFMTLLIGYGISGAMSRFYYETNDAKLRDVTVSTTILLMFGLVVGVTLPTLAFSKLIAWVAFGNKEWGHYIVLALLSFMASMTAKNAENYLLIRQRSIFLSTVTLIRLVFQLSLNIYFIVILELGVLGYLYSSLIDAVAYSIFMHTIAFRRVGMAFDTKIARKVLAFSLPLLPGYVAMFLRGNADRVILRTYLGLAAVGVFEMLFKFATLLGYLVVEPFSKIWEVKRFEVCDQEDGPEILSKVFTYHMASMMLLALLFSLEIPIILKLMTPEEFWLSGFIVYFAVLSRVFNGAYYHLFFGLLYAKKTWKISVIQWATAIGSLAITIPLIHGYKLLGAVIASYLSGVLQCTIGFFMARRYYKVPYEWAKICGMFVLTTMLFIIAKDFTIEESVFAGWLNLHVAPVIKDVLTLLSLDQVKSGKLLKYLVEGLPVVMDGILLFFYTGILLLGFVITKVIPTSIISGILIFLKLRKPLNSML